MKWPRSLVLLLGAAVCLSCTSGGGPVGTGISSISGNVVDVQTDMGAAASSGSAAALPRIQVSIDGLPDVSTMADAIGNFELSGDFTGTITLRFTVPEFMESPQLPVPADAVAVL